MPISQELLHFPHIYAGIQQQSGRRGPQRVGGMRVLSADVGIVLGSPFAPWEAVQVVLGTSWPRPSGPGRAFYSGYSAAAGIRDRS